MTRIRWWIYDSVPARFAWAVEIGSMEYQTFFAFNMAHARKIANRRFGPDSYLLNREWM